MAFTKIAPAGLSTSGNFTFGDVTVNSIQLSDGSAVGGAGLGTAIDGNDQIYYTNTVLSIGSTTTIDPPDSSNIAYTQYAEIAVEEGYDLIVEDGDDLVPDILGLSTETAGVLTGAGGRVRADNFTNKVGTGAPTFPSGVNVTGVSTFGNTVVGGATTELIVTGDARVTGILTIGTSSITLDGSENQVNVGTGVTIHHTNGVQVGGNTVHSTGITVNDINASGIITSTSFSGNVTGNITGNVTGDVTGNLSGNVNAGVVTATSNIVVGDKFINSSGIGLGTTDTTGRNSGVGTAIGTLVYNTSTLQVEVYDGYGWMGGLTTPFATSGDNPNPYTGYVSYTFTGPGSFVVSSGAGTVDLLLVAGGGAGGGDIGGGGGAGGVRQITGIPVTPGSYPIIVGGGAVAANPSLRGTDSTGLGYAATGGGSGEGQNTGAVKTGGCGGGGNGGGSAGGAGDINGYGEGNPGFSGYQGPPAYRGGGGGGAGSGGPTSSQIANGGNGVSNTYRTGSPVTYGGGGGGGNVSGSGGSGGGGTGGSYNGGSNGTAGAPNTGGGGGGAGSGGGTVGDNGGSGIVVVRVPIS